MKKLDVVLVIVLLFFSLNFVSATQTYLNESVQWQNSLFNTDLSALTWGDIDIDGSMDIIVSGRGASVGTKFTKVYRNNGTTLLENSSWQENLMQVSYGSATLGDIDNDGDLDLVLSGCNGTTDFTTECEGTLINTLIYINNGTSFIESSVWQGDLAKVYRSALALGDIDNDGDLDLSLIGETSNSRVSKIYINNGTTFLDDDVWQDNLTAIRKGSIVLGDIDNDGDLDLIISGQDGTNNKLTKVYINNGTSFIESSVWQDNLADTEDSSLSLGDIDNDGDLDLSLTGCCDIHRIYRNNGTSFLEINREVSGGLTGVFIGSQGFGDYDNDGDLDLITSGREEYTSLYSYNVSGENFTHYTQDPESHIANLEYGSLSWLNLDNDGDLDLIETGWGNYNKRAIVYISNRSQTKNNTQPNASISAFSSSYSNNVLALGWGNGSDNETSANGLYYNLMVGNATHNHTIVSGVYGGSSNPTAGYFGNMMQRKNISLNLELESNTTYYWYVQTIDTGLAKSNWSAVQSFTTANDTSKPDITINPTSPNNTNHTTNPVFIFNATITDANLTNVTLYADFNGTMIANETNATGGNGTYVFNKTLSSDGVYQWYIYACDGDSNCQNSSTRTLYLDRAYPIVTSISPAGGTTSTSASITFSYNVTDIDVANCSLIIDGSIDQTNTSITENTTQTFSKSMSNGAYTWYVNCTDYVGYVNSSASSSLTVSVSSGGSSGGSSSGGGSSAKTYTANKEEMKSGYTNSLAKGDKMSFSCEGENHSLEVKSIVGNIVNITLNSDPINFLILIGQQLRFDLDNNSVYDLLVKLNSIVSNKANLTITDIGESIGVTGDDEVVTEGEINETGDDTGRTTDGNGEPISIWDNWIVIVILLGILIVWWKSKNNKIGGRKSGS